MFPALLWLLFAQQPLDFLHISDTHVMQASSPASALQKERAPKTADGKRLTEFLGEQHQVDFILHTGDAIDALCFAETCDQLTPFAQILRSSKRPVYLALGNHDVERYVASPSDGRAVGDQSIAARARQDWRRAAKSLRKGSYYTFRKKTGGTTYRFYILENAVGEASRDRAFDAQQLQWLGRELERHPRYPSILAFHIPLNQSPFSKDLLQLLGQHPQVKLLLAGHRHSDGIEELPAGARKLPQIRTAGFVDHNAAARKIRLWPDRIEVLATLSPSEIERTIPTKN